MLTLKQTHRLNGRVTITIIQDIAVSSQPQIPIPSSASSAETGRELVRQKKSKLEQIDL